MGIRGIFQYLDTHPEIIQVVDLVEVARREGGIQLFIDATGFEIVLMERFQAGLCEAASKENPRALKANHYHISAIGGEYALMEKYVKRFIGILNDVNIDLVWYFDAGKGSTISTMDYRLNTFMDRRSKRVGQVKTINSAYSSGKQKVAELMLPGNSRYWNDEISPRLFKQSYFSLLRKLYDQDEPGSISGGIKQCAFGEADIQMAIDYLECNRNTSTGRPKPFAVVSSNCDFALLKQCRLIPFRSLFVSSWFDLNNDLDLQSAEPFAKVRSHLQKLSIRVVEADRFRIHFNLSDYTQVSDFAFICGTTFSYDLLHSGQGQVDANKIDTSKFGRSLDELANFIRSSQDLLKVPIIQEKIKAEQAAGPASNSCNLRLRDSIMRCRQYFNLEKSSREHIEESEAVHSNEMNLLFNVIRDRCYAPELMAMYRGLFWKTVNQEDLTFKEHSTTISQMLLPLRKIIYRIILPHGKTDKAKVVEFSLDPKMLRINQTSVCAAADGDYAGIEKLPHFTKIVPEQRKENLEFFESILRFLPSESLTPKYFKLKRKNGFACHLLRYFLTLNFEENLKVTNWQFLALCYSVLACKTGQNADVDIQWYAKLTTIPDVRCLTIMEWIQELYWHIGYLLASLFFLDKLFPQPAVLFSGSLFSAFYLCSLSVRQPKSSSRIDRFNEVSGRILYDQRKLHRKYYLVLKAIINDDFVLPQSV